MSSRVRDLVLILFCTLKTLSASALPTRITRHRVISLNISETKCFIKVQKMVLIISGKLLLLYYLEPDKYLWTPVGCLYVPHQRSSPSTLLVCRSATSDLPLHQVSSHPYFLTPDSWTPWTHPDKYQGQPDEGRAGLYGSSWVHHSMPVGCADGWCPKMLVSGLDCQHLQGGKLQVQRSKKYLTDNIISCTQ